MRLTPLSAAVAALAWLFVAAAPEPAAAQILRSQPGGYRPPPDRMPGWDWERTYPWSPYNYGRNPYNPLIVPQPYPYVYPYPYPVYDPRLDPLEPPQPPEPDVPEGGRFLSTLGPQVTIPHPSGALQTPPPGAAIIRVKVPDPRAQVRFDGKQTYTEGTTRYFVTPDLPEGKEYTYTLSASWGAEGRDVTRERKVKVARGHTTVIDLTRPEAK